MSSNISITDYEMTVQKLIDALQELVNNNPSLANSAVTRAIPDGSSTPIISVETVNQFGYVLLS